MRMSFLLSYVLFFFFSSLSSNATTTANIALTITLLSITRDPDKPTKPMITIETPSYNL